MTYWVPNGRWRSVSTGAFAPDVNPLLVFTPEVWEEGFTVFFHTANPDPLSSRLIFIKPTGMWLHIPSTDFYFGTDGIPGGSWAAYTFGHYELSEGGTWEVYLEVNSTVTGASGYCPVHGAGYEVGNLPGDVITGNGVPVTDRVGRFLTR